MELFPETSVSKLRKQGFSVVGLRGGKVSISHDQAFRVCQRLADIGRDNRYHMDIFCPCYHNSKRLPYEKTPRLLTDYNKINREDWEQCAISTRPKS